jgi:hypothetical protein
MEAHHRSKKKLEKSKKYINTSKVYFKVFTIEKRIILYNYLKLQ